MKRTRYQAGLNDFEYCVSLHVSHPSIDPKRVSEALGIMPERAAKVGEPRRTPTGKPLEGTYDHSHWWAKLDVIDNARLAESLLSLVDQLRPCSAFLRQLADEGGQVELFVGLFATELCDSVLPHDLLGDLAQLKLDLRLDYYSSDQREPISSDSIQEDSGTMPNMIEYVKAKEELRLLEERLMFLQQSDPVGTKGFTKAGIRKMIARLHEELALFEGSEEARAPEHGG